MSYRPRPGTECCTAQVSRIMPNFLARSWYLRDDDPVAALYAASRFSFEKSGASVTLRETTDYPFEDTIHFTVETDAPATFKLWLRVPLWCAAPELKINGEVRPVAAEPGVFRPRPRLAGRRPRRTPAAHAAALQHLARSRPRPRIRPTCLRPPHRGSPRTQEAETLQLVPVGATACA
ncbi:MAG: hypothetical protein GVY10_00865 [Verrucomicrobia bacterium]|nr:hypothetical protein [Verrucomicrobiota bacterium]